MLGDAPAFGSFSTNDIDAAQTFYADTLGLNVTRSEDEGMGTMLVLHHPGGHQTLIYPKDDHTPASHTVLNFSVRSLDEVAAALANAGVTLEQLDWTDEDGIARDADGRMPSMAWIRDPAGNWLALGEGMLPS